MLSRILLNPRVLHMIWRDDWVQAFLVPLALVGVAVPSRFCELNGKEPVARAFGL